MALSYVQYEGNGTQQSFAIPFPYLDKSHIEVRVALDVTAYTWDDPGTIRITPAPAPGAVVEARRITPRDTRMVDFVDSSVLTESDLDLANTQTFYIVQEAIDIAGGTLELLADGSYGAGGRRIKELGNPIEARDAVTKEYYEATFLPQLQALLNQTTTTRDGAVTARQGAETALAAAVAARDLALQYRDTANSHRQAAATSEANAATSAAGALTQAQNAATSATTANTHRTAAETARTGAETARTGAEGARDTALTHRNSAQGFRNEAETFKDQAAASAAAAATFDPSTYARKSGTDDLTITKNTARVKLRRGDNAASNDQPGLEVLNTSGTVVSTLTYDNAAGAWRIGTNAIMHAGNLDLSAYMPRSGGTFTGTLTVPTMVRVTGTQANYSLQNRTSADYWAFYSDGGHLRYWWGAEGGNGSAGDKFVFYFNQARMDVHGNPVIHTGNFMSYFHMRRIAWGQAGEYAMNTWTWNATGPAGTFATAMYYNGYTAGHYLYYYTLQFVWNGTWYTIQG